MTVRAPASAAAGQVAVGEVGERVGAEQDERVDPAVGGGLRGCRRRRGPARPAPCPTRSRTSSRPASSATRPGQHAGRQAHVEGAVDVGPAQGRQEAGAGPSVAGWPTAAAAMSAPASASEARPSTTVNGPLAQHLDGPGHVRRVGAGRGAAVAEQRVERLAPPRPGGSARDAAASSVEAGGRGRQLDELHPVLDDRVAQPQVQDRQLLLQVGAEQEDRAAGRQTSSMVARGRPSTVSAGRPSPSWASTLSVPITPLASLAQA